ncbi:hypothetical protein BDR05DRAFT_780248 [Suillus weaverae]|nr:hypothetical protein BDR05DRAFT_780248 [Suillus weaverae]
MHILVLNTTVHNVCITGDLRTAEDLITREIDENDNNHELYAKRSVVRTRSSDWDDALQDVVKVRYSIYHDALDDRSTQLCRIVYCHSALVIRLHFQGYCPLPQQAALRRMAFDFASICSNRDPMLVLIFYY